MNATLLTAIHQRAQADERFRQALGHAVRTGGLGAAAHLAREYGFDVSAPQIEQGDSLSDRELEHVAAGKGPVWIGPPFGLVVW